ncbi:hypothetical protein KKB99_01955 [bacterium]|nr:hypothetical protein [bacterium]MBU1024751.1 hypothetical protein [bacterium]
MGFRIASSRNVIAIVSFYRLPLCLCCGLPICMCCGLPVCIYTDILSVCAADFQSAFTQTSCLPVKEKNYPKRNGLTLEIPN